MNISPHQPQNVFFFRHVHRLYSVHGVQENVIDHQKFKIIPVVREEFILQMLHYGQNVEILHGILVVHS